MIIEMGESITSFFSNWLGGSKIYTFYYIIFFIFSIFSIIPILVLKTHATVEEIRVALREEKVEFFNLLVIYNQRLVKFTSGQGKGGTPSIVHSGSSGVESEQSYYLWEYAKAKFIILMVNMVLLGVGMWVLLGRYGDIALFVNGVPISLVLSYTGYLVWGCFSSLIVLLLIINFECLKYLQIKEMVVFWVLSVSILLALASNDFLTLVICLELVSFCLYICASLLFIEKVNNLNYLSAVYYFKYGLFATSLLILGLSLLYSQWGLWVSMDIYEIVQFEFCRLVNFKVVGGLRMSSADCETQGWGVVRLEMVICFLGLLLICLNFLFKLSIYPFHYWIIKVYRNVIFSIFCLFVIVTKLFFLGIFLTKFFNFMQMFSSLNIVLTCGGFLSLVVGGLGALFQNNFRLFIAYSSVASMGVVFLILGLQESEMLIVSVFYYIIYTLALYVLLCNMFFTHSVRSLELEETFVSFKKIFETHPFLFRLARLLLFMVIGVPLFTFFLNKMYIYLLLFSTTKILIYIALFVVFTVMAGYYLRLLRYSTGLDNSRMAAVASFDKYRAVKRYGRLLLVVNYVFLAGTGFNPLSAAWGLDSWQLLLTVATQC